MPARDANVESSDRNRQRRHHTRFTNSTPPSTMDNPVQIAFDQNDKKYRTCFGCHVRRCSLIIGFLEMIALMAAVVGTTVAYLALPDSQEKRGEFKFGALSHAELSLMGSLCAFVVGTICIGFMFFGLIKERPPFLLPHLIAQLTSIVGLLASVVVFVYVTLAESEYGPMISITYDWSKTQQNQAPKGVTTMEFVYGIIVIGLCGFACLLELYFLLIVYKTYAYFYDKRGSQEKFAPNSMQMVSTSTSFQGQDSIAAQRFLTQDQY